MVSVGVSELPGLGNWPTTAASDSKAPSYFSYLLEGETGLALEKVAEGMAAPLELDVIVHDDGRLKDLERLRPCHDTEAHYEQPQSKVHARIEDVPVCDTCQSQPPIVSA
jgi:hypothetical protein